MRYEATTPGALDTTAANLADPMRAMAARGEQLRQVEAERDALIASLCSLLVHDGARHGGRVASALIVRVIAGLPLPWQEATP